MPLFEGNTVVLENTILFSGADTELASSTLLADENSKDIFGMVISYTVKVSKLAQDYSFFFMHFFVKKKLGLILLTENAVILFAFFMFFFWECTSLG